MFETFAALSEPNRLRIFDMLREGPRPVGLIADRLKLNQPQVSKHLNVLKRARLVAVEAKAQQRLYRLDPHGLKTVHDWLEQYRRIWDVRFDQMDEIIAQLMRDEAQAPKGD